MGQWVHVLSDIDEDARTATCQECGPGTRIRIKNAARTGPGRWRCGYQRRGRGPKSKESTARRSMRETSDGRCEICGEIPEVTLCIDHDHDTGFVRGLLCRQCNLGLGLFGDDPDRLAAASEYLRAATSRWEESQTVG